jgi:hypothetical protein
LLGMTQTWRTPSYASSGARYAVFALLIRRAAAYLLPIKTGAEAPNHGDDK